MTLQAFIEVHRSEILGAAHSRALARTPLATGIVQYGLPLFLDQLCEVLRCDLGPSPCRDAISVSAGQHGGEMFRNGLSMSQVVQDYGDVRRAVGDLSECLGCLASPGEIRVLNSCVDDAIASAASEFDRQHSLSTREGGVEKMGVLAHEMRNAINSATLSFDGIKSGKSPSGGALSSIHERSLRRMNQLVDRSLADVRLDSGVQQVERVRVNDVLEEVALDASLFVKSSGIHLVLQPEERSSCVMADRGVLGSAITNLLQNALKFTRPHSTVILRSANSSGRVRIDVEDECGGLPPGSGDLTTPYKQAGTDRSGLGLGLSICAKAARSGGGSLRSRDIPGHGCVFTLDLPASN